MKSFFKVIVDNTDSNSLATKLRKKRFAFFHSLLETVPGPLKILDVGGTTSFWEMMEFAGNPEIEITLANINKFEVKHPNMRSVEGDARSLDNFRLQEFDVVFSNSVIEHVGDFSDQRRMAEAVMRVGKRYFIQTPNYYFPIEPHFVFPFFQFLPVSWRVLLLQHFKLGWYERMPDYTAALAQVHEIRLLTKKELHSLFPKANVYCETILGLNKSFIVYDGWDTNKK